MTIDGKGYQFEEGMTWEQWVNSRYDTGLADSSYKVVGNQIMISIQTGSGPIAPMVDHIVQDTNGDVKPTDKIKENTNYILTAEK